MSKKYTNEEFLKLLESKRSDIFPLEEYKGMNTLILFSDNDKNLFKLKPSNALRYNKCLTYSCVNKNENFNNQLQKIFPNLTLIGEYVCSKRHVIVEDDLGIQYKIKPNDLLNRNFPYINSAINKTEWFIKKSSIVHNNKYTYSRSKYSNAFEKLIITCPIHGDFEQIASSHLYGIGCPSCGKIQGYRKEDWIRLCNNNKKADPKLYIIKCFNGTENFIKIGITFHSIDYRFNSNIKLSYSYEVLKEIKGSPDFIWNKEKELHKLCKEFKYKPLTPFCGKTECFTLEVLSLLNL